MNLSGLLKLMVEKGISDIHFKADASPAVRFNGRLVPATNIEKLSAADIQTMVGEILNKEQLARLEDEDELDMAYSLPGVSRFRVNLFRQRSTLSLSLRVIPLRVKGFQELNLPKDAMERFSGETRGLILFSGITGAGKTTSMNSFVQHLNETQQYRIITVEDPIEFYHQDVKSSIVQREIGGDTHSFAMALKHVLRQDPDVVVIGEMRDPETIQAALTAAETGHLVLSTIHTMDAVQTIDRIVDSFPAQQGGHVRQQLSLVLKGVLAQRLLRSKDGAGRFPASEVLYANTMVRRLVSEGKTGEVYKAMEAGQYYAMHTFDQDMLRLMTEGKIDQKEVLENASNPEDMALKIRAAGGMAAA
ncbi:MAG TPA: PilT/PilU family type 4a pilus ATPase [Elusimicrobiota bacterium]|jgi:twitching motility protein PilT|nr:PilT/PilU family type 4a pilus ATPase [Elusimicrobiota bacterium]